MSSREIKYTLKQKLGELDDWNEISVDILDYCKILGLNDSMIARIKSSQKLTDLIRYELMYKFNNQSTMSIVLSLIDF